MKLKKLYIMFTFLIICSLINVAFADSWSLIESDGNWLIIGRTAWETDYDDIDSFLIYKFNNTNPFTKWTAKVEETVCLYETPARFVHRLEFILTDETTTISLFIVWFVDTTNPIRDQRIDTFIYVTNPDNYSDRLTIYCPGGGKHYPIKFIFTRLDNETLNLKFGVYPDNSFQTAIKTYETNYTLSISFFDSAYVKQIIKKSIIVEYGERFDSKIKLGGKLTDEIFECSGSFGTSGTITGMGFWEYLAWTIWNSITGEITYIGSKLRELMPFLGWLYDALSFCFTFTVGVIQNIVSISLPILPIIALFWFLDAALTSVIQGNLHPIGTAFMTVYDFLRGVIQTIVNIIGTIWEYLSGLKP